MGMEGARGGGRDATGSGGARRPLNSTTLPRALTTLIAGLGLAFTMSCAIQKDNFETRIACNDYCDKKFECDGADPTRDEKRACRTDCRETIENECGNEHQAAVNDKMAECKDQSCGGFWTCMVFETAPQCLGFVGD